MMRPKISAEAAGALQPPLSRVATREEWLEEALPIIGSIFEDAGYDLPPCKVSCSFPGGGSAKRRIGECWPKALSAGAINEVFISPFLDDPIQVLDVLAHECVHVMDDCQSGHGKPFKEIALAIGLEGKMRQASAGADLKLALAAMAGILGPYPHAKLRPPGRRQRPRRKAAIFRCEGCEGEFRCAPAKAAEVQCCPFCGDPLSQAES